MNRLIGALLAAAAIGAAAGPALAHPDDDDDDNAGYSQYFDGYQNFDALYQHDWQGCCQSNGNLSPPGRKFPSPAWF